MVLAERRSLPGRQVRTVRVRVQGGYLPPLVHGRVGEPLRIVFRREESASCSEHVVFPAFGKSAMLPPFEDVAIELVPERAGEYEFTCQLGVLRGRFVVEGDRFGPTPLREPPLAGRASRQWGTPVPAAHRDTVLLGLLAWLCSLPLVLLVAVPWLGWRAGGLLALVWLGAVAAACFAVCTRRIGPRRTSSPARRRGRLPRRPDSVPRRTVG